MAKRLRDVRSSNSLIDLNVVPKSEPEPVLFTVGSPEQARSNIDDQRPAKGLEEFFRTCVYCKKEICNNQDIFLYRYFLAFCHPICRAEYMKRERNLAVINIINNSIIKD